MASTLTNGRRPAAKKKSNPAAPCKGVGRGGRGKSHGRKRQPEGSQEVRNKGIGWIHLTVPFHTLVIGGGILLFSILGVVDSSETHQPFKWSLLDPGESRVIQTIITSGAPTFQVDPCQLAPLQPSCTNRRGIYMCPNRRDYCHYPGEYYCAYWGCETIATEWSPGGGPDKYLKVQWGPYGCRASYDKLGGVRDRGTCRFFYLNVTLPNDSGWDIGRTWGIRYYEMGITRIDPGRFIEIRKEPVPNDPSPVGPNRVISRVSSNSLNLTTMMVKDQSFAENRRERNKAQAREKDSLEQVLYASYEVLNQMNPNLTEHCWLCYDIRPPYYEAIGISNKAHLSSQTNPPQCLWSSENPLKQGMTISQVTGQGRCIGNVPSERQYLCNKTVRGQKSTYRAQKWLIPAKNTKWICSLSGVTPCIALKIFNWKAEYCIQVAIIPRIIYHPENFIYDAQPVTTYHLQKREPITALTVATLMAIGTAGAGTGIASLIQQSQKFHSLRVAVDEDLARIEKAMTALEKSVRSLSEVVLQNRRGLDLMFMKEGGLCAALREECCVYVDHTGVARDSISKLREGLEKRKREREAQQSWYESMFNYSPWLTTLLSTIVGPLILFILVLTFGPCIFNRLVNIVKGRLEAAHLMLLKSQYNQIKDDISLQEVQAVLEKLNEQNW